jgi:uncharacterized RDD family membrane protein YckC
VIKSVAYAGLVPKLTRGWLEGPPLPPKETPRGVRLGLPAEGPGSVSGFGPRLLAFLVDAVVANLLAGIPYLFGVHYHSDQRGVVVFGAFLLMELVLVATAGQTLGMRVMHVRVMRPDGGLPGFGAVLLRTVLLGLLIPAVIWDHDGRGLHDRAAGVVVVRDPAAAEDAKQVSGRRRGSA